MRHEFSPLEMVQASNIILRNAPNLMFGSAYAFGENNRRTFFWKGWGRMPAGKSQGVFGHCMGIAFTPLRLQRESRDNSISTLAFMTHFALTPHIACCHWRGNHEGPNRASLDVR